MGCRGTSGHKTRSRVLKVTVLVLAAFLSGTVRAAAFRAVNEGSPAPDFRLSSVKGEEVSLSGLRGRVVVIAFVAQGQDKSEQALRALSTLDPALAGRSAIVAILVNPDEGDASAWAVKSGAPFPVLVDAAKATFRQYGVFVTPATAVVRADGVFQGEASGYSAAFKGEVEGLLKVALGEARADQVKAAADRARPTDETPQRLASRKEMENARKLAARKKGSEALEAAKKAVAADESNGPAHSLLGNLLLDASDGNAAEASIQFQRAGELSPKDVDAKIGVARLKALKGDTDGAVTILEEAVKLNPKPQRVYYREGLLYEKAGEYEKAADAYRRALARMFAE